MKSLNVRIKISNDELIADHTQKTLKQQNWSSVL